MWENRQVDEKIEREAINLWPWQQALVDEINGPANRRKVIWICDSVGNLGKSTLAEWLMINMKNEVIVLKNMSMRDSGNFIMNAHDAGWTGRAVIIDLARTTENVKQVYEVIESIKDGYVINQKYQSRGVQMKILPHVIVFSNWMPITSYLSSDRWDLRVPTGGWEDVDEYGGLVRKEREKVRLLRISQEAGRSREPILFNIVQREVRDSP